LCGRLPCRWKPGPPWPPGSNTRAPWSTCSRAPSAPRRRRDHGRGTRPAPIGGGRSGAAPEREERSPAATAARSGGAGRGGEWREGRAHRQHFPRLFSCLFFFAPPLSLLPRFVSMWWRWFFFLYRSIVGCASRVRVPVDEGGWFLSPIRPASHRGGRIGRYQIRLTPRAVRVRGGWSLAPPRPRRALFATLTRLDLRRRKSPREPGISRGARLHSIRV
jgi:hypothetical protein